MQELVNEKMKLNKFVDVKLPKNKVLFQRCQNMTLPVGSHDVPVADFTSRNLECLSAAQSVVISDYNDVLRTSHMPLDTDISSVENIDAE